MATMRGPLNAAVAETIRAWLAREGREPTTFGPEIGINRETMRALVAGTSPWRVDYLQLVARALSTSVTEILRLADPTGELTDFRPGRAGTVIPFPSPVGPLPDDLADVALDAMGEPLDEDVDPTR